MYAVLPASLIFVSAFSRLSQTWGRQKLFYAALTLFLSFFGLFTMVLYPMGEALYPTALTAFLTASLPSGFSGGIAVVNNWTLSLFYVFSELWGDVVLSLLFWGLANETTRLHEAGIIYPLLGKAVQVDIRLTLG